MPARLKMAGRLCIAIDPSTTKVGVAFGEIRKPFKPKHLKYSAPVALDRTDDFVQRTAALVEVVEGLRKFHLGPGSLCVIEMPQVWASPKGIRAATSGALEKLFFAVGALWTWGRHAGLETHLVPVSQWKGQLPKQLICDRLRAQGFDVPNTSGKDESDAVGLLAWFANKNG